MNLEHVIFGVMFVGALGASLAVRERGGEQSTVSVEELLERFRVEIATISA